MKSTLQEKESVIEIVPVKQFPVSQKEKKRDRLISLHPSAVIGENVSLGKGVIVGPKVVIDDHCKIGKNVHLKAGSFVGKRCVIGEGTVIEPHATIRDGSILGRRVRVHSGAVIGSDGFGFAPTREGHKKKIPQIGIVEIGDDVMIGSNCTVDRATLGRTVIGNGTVIQDLVQVAHNVKIGSDCVVGAQSGICGSATLGSSVKLGYCVGIIGHIKIENNCRLDDFTAISKSLPAGSHLVGYPALPPQEAAKWRQMQVEMPQLYERVRSLEQQMKEKEIKSSD